GDIIYAEGGRSERFLTVLNGWALQFATTRGGGRQIFSFLLPGDHIALELLGFDRLDFGVEAVTDVVICAVEIATLNRLIDNNPAAFKRRDAHYRCMSVRTHQHLISLGRRSAAGRIASFFIELSLRLASRGFSDLRRLPFPIRQREMADALGLTPVHVSRVLQTLRSKKIADVSRGMLSIEDKDELVKIAGLWDPDLDVSRHGID